MIPIELSLIDASGNRVVISAESIKKIEARLEITPVGPGGMFAGPASEFVFLTTSSGSHKIPRGTENDSELLTFILAKGLSA